MRVPLCRLIAEECTLCRRNSRWPVQILSQPTSWAACLRVHRLLLITLLRRVSRTSIENTLVDKECGPQNSIIKDRQEMLQAEHRLWMWVSRWIWVQQETTEVTVTQLSSQTDLKPWKLSKVLSIRLLKLLRRLMSTFLLSKSQICFQLERELISRILRCRATSTWVLLSSRWIWWLKLRKECRHQPCTPT